MGGRYRLRFIGLQVTNPNAAVSLTARPSPYDRRINQQIAEMWELIPDDVFLIKLNYTFLY